MKHSFWDHRCEAEADIFVTGFYDLRNLDRPYKEIQVETKGAHVYNAYGPNYLELTLELERRAYAPGEKMSFAATVNFVNRNCPPPIPGVKVMLIQVCSIIC